MNDLTNFLYSTGGTRRYHNRPELNQDVAQHSWGVAVIILTMHPNPSVNLLKAAILHDSPEKVYGDIVSPTKVAFPEAKELDLKCARLFWEDVKNTHNFDYPELTEEEELWLSFADMYECCLMNKDKNQEVYQDALSRSNAVMQLINERYTD